jgi:hypothetical protein
MDRLGAAGKPLAALPLIAPPPATCLPGALVRR